MAARTRLELAATQPLQFQLGEPIPVLGPSLMENEPMRDDQVPSNDRKNAEGESSAAVRGRAKEAQGSLSSADSTDVAPGDAPAPLSAVSYPADTEEVSLTDEEIVLYRRRIAEGLYNTREVAEEVARRMMRRGDI